MKSVLISIRPEWCEKILGGEKTMEVRKSRPNLSVPFKCYIYCTKSADMLWVLDVPSRREYGFSAICANLENPEGASQGNGKVIAEFTCTNIDFIIPDSFVVKEDAEKALSGSCLTPRQAKDYAGWPGKQIWCCKDLHGWYISNLKIYDIPKELSEFRKCCGTQNCDKCQFWENTGEYAGCLTSESRKLRRPPQSWCYVEELP